MARLTKDEYRKQYEKFMQEQKARWVTYTKEQKDYLKRRKEEDKLAAKAISNKYGHGFSQLGITEAQVESALYGDAYRFIDETISATKSKKSGNFDADFQKAHGRWEYVDVHQRVSVIVNMEDGKYPSVTVHNQTNNASLYRIVTPEDWDELYQKTNRAVGRSGGGYTKADEFYLAEMEGYKHDPEFEKKQREMLEAKAKEAEEARKKREEQAAIMSQYYKARDEAEEERKLMSQLVSKHEFSLLLHNKNKRPDEWSPDYLNRKHPDQTAYYTQYAKGVVAINQGYRTPYYEDYEALAKKNLNLKPKNQLNSIEQVQAMTYAEEANAYSLAMRAKYYEDTYPDIVGRSEELYNYQVKLSERGLQLGNLANTYGLASPDAPVDNSKLFVPSYTIKPMQAGDTRARFSFHAVQDFDNNADKSKGIPDKRTRKGNNLNESFLPVHRGKNFPPKKVFVVEGVSTAISAAALLDLENHPEKDDIWVVSAFDAGNLVKVVKNLNENLGDNTQIIALLDNDKKIKKDPHGRPMRDANGELIEDLLAQNAGKQALQQITEYVEDIETLPIHKYTNQDGSVGFNIAPKNIACVTTPIEYVDVLKKESDVNDFDINLMKSGVPLEKRKEQFKKSYLDKIEDYELERYNRVISKLDTNKELMDFTLDRLAQAEIAYKQSLSAQAASEQVQNYVEQSKVAPESAVEAMQANNQQQQPQPASNQDQNIQQQYQQQQQQQYQQQQYQQQEQAPRRPMP